MPPKELYYGDNPQLWARFFAAQTGGNFVGNPYQRGGFALGSLLRGIARTVLPIVGRIGKSVGKEALKTGLSVASDAAAGVPIRESFETHGRQAARNLLRRGAKAMGATKGTRARGTRRRKRQVGSGRRHTRRVRKQRGRGRIGQHRYRKGKAKTLPFRDLFSS